jgi:hypothetical protein
VLRITLLRRKITRPPRRAAFNDHVNYYTAVSARRRGIEGCRPEHTAAYLLAQADAATADGPPAHSAEAADE